jgi:hypothetical protein
MDREDGARERRSGVLDRARRLSLIALLLLCAAGGCGQRRSAADAATSSLDGSQSAACHGDSDCHGPGVRCFGPNDTNCGIPPRQPCADDAQCPAGERCHSVEDECSADRVGSMCGPPCGAGGPACDPGFVCSASGSCRPRPCDDPDMPFACRAPQRCDATTIDPSGPAYNITHGCVDIHCQTAATCPAGSDCVNGRCQAGPGECEPPAP